MKRKAWSVRPEGVKLGHEPGHGAAIHTGPLPLVLSPVPREQPLAPFLNAGEDGWR